jgi:hypothetical protein
MVVPSSQRRTLPATPAAALGFCLAFCRRRRHRQVVLTALGGCMVVLTFRRLLVTPTEWQHVDATNMITLPPPIRTIESESTGQQYVRRNKRGKVVMKAITKVSLKDLVDLTEEDLLLNANTNSSLSFKQAIQDKEPILKLLHDAGVKDLDVAVIAQLPTWSQVTKLYGDSDKPVVYGLETCAAFRVSVPADQAYLATAGFFDTGTNALTYYMRANLVMPSHTTPGHHDGILTQVPWDKHWFSRLRNNHTANNHEQYIKKHVLPIVTIRDPLSWMQSLCQQPYLVRWPHSTKHCPNLVPDSSSDGELGRDSNSFPVSIPSMTGSKEWPSLAHLWNDYYRDYLTTTTPRLMVRFEDLLFRPKQVLEIVKECAGAAWKDGDEHNFYYVVDQSKWEHVRQHGPQSNLISAMIKHGNPARRTRNMTQADLQYAASVLDEELLRFFHYQRPGV